MNGEPQKETAGVDANQQHRVPPQPPPSQSVEKAYTELQWNGPVFAGIVWPHVCAGCGANADNADQNWQSDVIRMSSSDGQFQVFTFR